MSIGETIRAARKEHGMSQEDLAGLLHVSRQSVSNWENNRNYPDLDTLLAISKHFDISLDTLLDDDLNYVHQNVSAVKTSHKQRKLITLLITALIAMAAVLVIIINHQNQPYDSSRLDIPAAAHMDIGKGTVHNYSEDPDEISAVANTLCGEYIALKQVLADPEKGAYDIQLWDDPDGVWEEIIVLDEKHIVYNSWKCKKTDAPINIHTLEKIYQN